jgi:hypothetical protein
MLFQDCCAVEKTGLLFLAETQPAGANLNYLTGSISIPVLKRVTPNFPHETKEENIITHLNVPGMLPNSGAVIAQDDSMAPSSKTEITPSLYLHRKQNQGILSWSIISGGKLLSNVTGEEWQNLLRKR